MKNKITILILIYTVIYLFGLLAIDAGIGTPPETIYRKIEIPIEKIVEKQIIVEKTCAAQNELLSASMPWLEARAEIADHEYKLDTYNCKQFTEDLVTALDEMDIFASPVTGWHEGTYHAWTVVHIESQTGKFIKVSDGYEIEMIRTKRPPF